LTVKGEVATGAAAPILMECSRVAEFTVVGDRGLGGFVGLLVGSIAVELAAHSPTPVIVVRGQNQTEGPVMVGVDGSPANQPAIGHAFQSASLRHAPLVAVHAWSLPHPIAPRAVPRTEPHFSGVAAEEERLLSEAMAGWAEQYPDGSGLPTCGQRLDRPLKSPWRPAS
jgi:nucleotide-binding universal stress UspA family protein